MANYESRYTGAEVDNAVEIAQAAVTTIRTPYGTPEKSGHTVEIDLGNFGINIDSTYINRVGGVTSNVQNQIDGKADNVLVTQLTDGLMSKDDKKKLDILVTAGNTDLPSDATLATGTLYCYYIE